MLICLISFACNELSSEPTGRDRRRRAGSEDKRDEAADSEGIAVVIGKRLAKKSFLDANFHQQDGEQESPD